MGIINWCCVETLHTTLLLMISWRYRTRDKWVPMRLCMFFMVLPLNTGKFTFTNSISVKIWQIFLPERNKRNLPIQPNTQLCGCCCCVIVFFFFSFFFIRPQSYLRVYEWSFHKQMFYEYFYIFTRYKPIEQWAPV